MRHKVVFNSHFSDSIGQSECVYWGIGLVNIFYKEIVNILGLADHMVFVTNT